MLGWGVRRMLRSTRCIGVAYPTSPTLSAAFGTQAPMLLGGEARPATFEITAGSRRIPVVPLSHLAEIFGKFSTEILEDDMNGTPERYC